MIVIIFLFTHRERFHALLRHYSLRWLKHWCVASAILENSRKILNHARFQIDTSIKKQLKQFRYSWKENYKTSFSCFCRVTGNSFNFFELAGISEKFLTDMEKFDFLMNRERVMYRSNETSFQLLVTYYITVNTRFLLRTGCDDLMEFPTVTHLIFVCSRLFDKIVTTMMYPLILHHY